MMKFRVLIISDDTASAKMMQNILRHHRLLTSHELKAADAAIAHLRESEPYHIILSDLGAARPGSIDVLQRARERSPDTKVIVVTGFGDHQLVIDAIKAGAYGYLHKPFRPEELNLVLNNLTNHFSQSHRLQHLSEALAELEEDDRTHAARLEHLEHELQDLHARLQKYEPRPGTLDLDRAIAQATVQRAGVPRGYSVVQELTNLGNMLDERKISEDEYQKIRRTVLEKAYQVPLA